MLSELLGGTEAEIHCLIRADDREHARQRLTESLQVYDPEGGQLDRLRERVIPVIGDVREPKLGLPDDEYRALSGKVRRVFHLAADVRLVASYRSLALTNVRGAEEIIRFCLESDAVLVHGSTYSVMADKAVEEGTVFKEPDLDIGQGFLAYDYERTKMEAEKAIRAARSEGLRSVVVRMGDVFGDSVTGRYPLSTTRIPGIYYDAIRTGIETGIAFSKKDNLYLVPVDYVARSMLHLSSLDEAYGKTFHLTGQRGKTVNDLTRLLRGHGYRIQMVPFDMYLSLFKSNSVSRSGRVYRSAFTSVVLAYADEMHQVDCAYVDTTNADTFLGAVGITCPEMDQRLISLYLDYCVQQGYLPDPNSDYPVAEIIW